MTMEELFQQASNDFLCEAVPDGWWEWEEETQHRFIRDYVWEPLGSLTSEEIIAVIEASAESWMKFFTRRTENEIN